MRLSVYSLNSKKRIPGLFEMVIFFYPKVCQVLMRKNHILRYENTCIKHLRKIEQAKNMSKSEKRFRRKSDKKYVSV